MKKLIYSVTLFSAMSMMLASCDKNGDGDTPKTLTIKAQVETMTEYESDSTVKRVRATTETGGTLASADYTNSSFSFTFPETVLEELFPISDKEAGMGNYTFNDSTVKGTSVYEIQGFSSSSGEFSNADYVGYFELRKMGYVDSDSNRPMETTANFLYVDKPVIITGTIYDTIPTDIDDDGESDFYQFIESTANLSLAKGWNIVYMIVEPDWTEQRYTTRMTTTPVNGLKWYFFIDNYSDDNQTTMQYSKKKHLKHFRKNNAKLNLFKNTSFKR